jgi:hypothetical protein
MSDFDQFHNAKISKASNLSLVSSLIFVYFNAVINCLNAVRSTPLAFYFMSALDNINTMSMASSTSPSALFLSDLKNCYQAAISCSPK